MRILPVLDLKGGLAVHAVAGDRARYAPVRSLLNPNADPIGLARAVRDRLGLAEVYLADLDAIVGGPPQVATYRALVELNLSVWVDAGIRDRGSLVPGFDSGAVTWIVGLETLQGPQALGEIVAEVGPERLAFGLDLRGGHPLLAPGAVWPVVEPRELAACAVGFGLTRLVVLDLARVGTGQGAGTLPLIRELSTAHPGIEIIAGGGVAHPADLTALAHAGASATLVGSALHSGRIGPEDLARLNSATSREECS